MNCRFEALSVFFEKMEESRPPLFFNFKGGPLSSIFSQNHSKCLKMAIYGLKVDIFKEIAILRHLEWFLEKMSESRPPLKLKNKMSPENGQKSSFYIVKSSKL